MKSFTDRLLQKSPTTDDATTLSARPARTENVTAFARKGLAWAEAHVPGGTWAVPRLKNVARRVIPAPPAAADMVGVQPKAPPRPPLTPAPVVADVPIDLAHMTVYRAEYFPDAGPHPWLDDPEAESFIAYEEQEGRLKPEDAALCRYWARNGYVILPGVFEHDLLDHVWAAYEAKIDTGVLKPPPEAQFQGDPVPGRLLDPHLTVPEISDLMHHPVLLGKVQMLLGASCTPFQSISGHKASQQAIHSDSIHMTTYPTGYLAALWIAFEDIEPGSGPLEYYPSSHRLPTIYSREVGISETAIRESGYQEFDMKYTPYIRKRIEEVGLAPQHFHARKGDVLIWHANLLHGGSARTDFTKTRRALVFHYFAQGCVCYHDLSASLSRIHV